MHVRQTKISSFGAKAKSLACSADGRGLHVMGAPLVGVAWFMPKGVEDSNTKALVEPEMACAPNKFWVVFGAKSYRSQWGSVSSDSTVTLMFDAALIQ